MIYLDLFDGVKSAHPKLLSPEWWRPNTFEEQEQSREIARAELMVRLLYGDTIVLPNNQAVDSVAWLQIAADFSSLDLDWTPLTVSISGVQNTASEEALLDLMLRYFSSPNFLLTAWIGLDDPQKKRIAENLRQSKNNPFGKMLWGIGKTSNTKVSDLLESQAFGLQKFYEYLARNRAKNVMISSKAVGPYIWPRVKSLKDIPNGIPGKVIQHIEKLIGPDKVEIRSLLYYALADIEEPTRSITKLYIDRFYNEKLGLSVTGGKGVYTMLDHDPNTLSTNDEEIDALADKSNTVEGLLGRTVLQYYPQKIHTYLKWNEFLEILKDHQFSASVTNLRKTLNEYDSLNPSDSNYLKHYQTWLSRSLDALNHHQDLLARYLASNAIQKDNKLVIFIGSWINAISSLTGGIVAYSIENQVTSASLTDLLHSLVGGKTISKKFTTAAAGRYRTALKDAVIIKPDEELLK